MGLVSSARIDRFNKFTIMKIFFGLLLFIGIVWFLITKKKKSFNRKFDQYKDDPYYSQTYEDPHGDGG